MFPSTKSQLNVSSDKHLLQTMTLHEMNHMPILTFVLALPKGLNHGGYLVGLFRVGLLGCSLKI